MRNLALLVILPSVAQAEFQLEPTLHLNAVTGLTSSGEPKDLANHAHDPIDDLGLQGLELGMNVRYHTWLEGFANINSFTDSEGELGSEWEEGFLKLPDLPGGFSLRAGRYLNRFGLQNNVHLHGWDFASGNLSTPRFLGEEGLTTEGAELTWLREFDQGFFALSGSFGKIASHGHDHGHGEEEGHEEEGHEEEGHEEHGHSDDTTEKGYFGDTAWSVRALLGYNQSDFHQHRFGISAAGGENNYGSGRDTELIGVDYSYTWRENGLEEGGKEASFGVEYIHGSVDWVHEEDADEFGTASSGTFMAYANYRFLDNWVGSARYEKSNGRQEGFELHEGEAEYAYLIPDQERFTAALTHVFPVGDFDSHVRLQYQYDDLPEDTVHSIWLQFQLSFGSGEIR